MFDRWDFTVVVLTTIWAAISLLDRPLARRSRASRSFMVSGCPEVGTAPAFGDVPTRTVRAAAARTRSPATTFRTADSSSSDQATRLRTASAPQDRKTAP